MRQADHDILHRLRALSATLAALTDTLHRDIAPTLQPLPNYEPTALSEHHTGSDVENAPE